MLKAARVIRRHLGDGRGWGTRLHIQGHHVWRMAKPTNRILGQVYFQKSSGVLSRVWSIRVYLLDQVSLPLPPSFPSPSHTCLWTEDLWPRLEAFSIVISEEGLLDIYWPMCEWTGKEFANWIILCLFSYIRATFVITNYSIKKFKFNNDTLFRSLRFLFS